MDIAFDRGYMTLDGEFRVEYCADIKEVLNGYTYEHEIRPYEGRRITDCAVPIDQEYLEYHRRHVFKDHARA